MAEKYCFEVIESNTDCKTSGPEYLLLNKERMLIGNAAHCDIKVKSNAPEHAVIFQGFSRWFLKKITKDHDLFVNHEAMNVSNGYHLKDGDLISLGCVALKFTKLVQNEIEVPITKINEEIVYLSNGNNENLEQELSQQPLEENSIETFTNLPLPELDCIGLKSYNLQKPNREGFTHNSRKNLMLDTSESSDKYLKLEKDYNLNQRYISSLESDIEELHKYYKSAFEKETKHFISKLKKLEDDCEFSRCYVTSLESDYEELKNFYQQRNVRKIEELEMELRAAKVNHDNFRTESMVERNKLTLAIWQKDMELLAEKESTWKLQIRLEDLNKSHDWTLYQKSYLETKLSNLEKTYSQVHKVHLEKQEVAETLDKVRAKFRTSRNQHLKTEQDLKLQLEEKELEKKKLNVDFVTLEEKYKKEVVDLHKQIDHLHSINNRVVKNSLEKKREKVCELNGKLSLKELELLKKNSEIEDLRKKYDEELAISSTKINTLVMEKLRLKQETESKLEKFEETLKDRNTEVDRETNENSKLSTQIKELRESYCHVLKDVKDLLVKNSELKNEVAAFQKEKMTLIKDYMDKLALKDEEIGGLKLNLMVPESLQNETDKFFQKDKEIQRLKDSELVYVSKLSSYEKQVHKLEVEMVKKESTLDAFRFSMTSLEADFNIQKRASEETLSKETAQHLETKDKLSEKQKEVIELYQVFQNLHMEFQESLVKHMENELSCAVCSDLLNEAVTLNCTHTFCSGCISIWRHKKNECPICRSNILHEVKVPAINTFIEKAKADMEKSLIGYCEKNTKLGNVPDSSNCNVYAPSSSSYTPTSPSDVPTSQIYGSTSTSLYFTFPSD